MCTPHANRSTWVLNGTVGVGGGIGGGMGGGNGASPLGSRTGGMVYRGREGEGGEGEGVITRRTHAVE